MFHRIVKKGRDVRGGLLRTLVEKRVANVDPPGVFAASVSCHGTCANCQAREKDASVCAVARHTLRRRRVPGACRGGLAIGGSIGAVDDMLLIGRASYRPSWPVTRPRCQPLSLTCADGHRPPCSSSIVKPRGWCGSHEGFERKSP